MFFLKYKTETGKTVQRQLHILHNISKFRHFVTYQITSIDMPTTLMKQKFVKLNTVPRPALLDGELVAEKSDILDLDRFCMFQSKS